MAVLAYTPLLLYRIRLTLIMYNYLLVAVTTQQGVTRTRTISTHSIAVVGLSWHERGKEDTRPRDFRHDKGPQPCEGRGPIETQALATVN